MRAKEVTESLSELDHNIRNNINEIERTGNDYGTNDAIHSNDPISALMSRKMGNNDFFPLQIEMMRGKEHTPQDRDMTKVGDNKESKDDFDRQL